MTARRASPALRADGPAAALTDREFADFQRFIYDAAGISLSAAKKPLVTTRLAKRLDACGSASYGDYFQRLAGGDDPAEVQRAIDLLTTNETYFFREPKHFELLRAVALEARAAGTSVRAWSAASSSGEEAFSMAMVLEDCLGGNAWEVLGSDISASVLERARRGHYAEGRATQIPPPYLKRFCLKGTAAHAGTLLVDRALRARVSFVQANLNATLPRLGRFDVIFLRNVLIYFDLPTRQRVVRRVIELLAPGGHFCIGHSETLNGVTDSLEPVAPSIYRAPGGRKPAKGAR